jgi:hypothetical protein
MNLRKFCTLNSSFFTRKHILFFCFLSIGTITHSQQNIKLHFDQIPISDADLIAPGRGVEEWMGMNQINLYEANNSQKPPDTYTRFEWGQIETAKKKYDFTYFDAVCARAIKNKQHFSFGVMSLCTSCTPKTVEGAKLIYPEYLHNLMQKDVVKDWIYNGIWVPNWNAEDYLVAWEDLLNALNNHLQNTTIEGVRLFSIINYIDIRGYGNWGEWHTYPYKNEEPYANKPTVSTLLRIIDAHKNAFSNFRLMAMSDAFDTKNWSSIPAEVGYYLLTAQNAVGQFGWRRDNWGDPAVWYKDKLENNNTIFNGVVFKTLIMNKWKYAPIVGEPSSCCTNIGGDCPYWELETQIKKYHTSSFANGNLESANLHCVQSNIRAASKVSGYRIILEEGQIKYASKDRILNINLKWKNIGIAPIYENWSIYFQLRNTENKIVWTKHSILNLKSLIPYQYSTTTTDKFALPPSLSLGTYQLYLIITDPYSYRKPFPLAIKGRNPDGSYNLATIVIKNDP